MFKLQPNPTFTAKVFLSIPGETQPKAVRFTFRHKTREQFKAWLESLEGRQDKETLLDIVAGWDRADIDCDFSAEAFAALLDNFPASGSEIFDAYRREALESRRKN